MKPYWLRAAEYCGISLDDHQVAQMHRYSHWLADEAVRAGGIGPAEPARIDQRHLADSVLFISQVRNDVERIWDLGSGVGLPGIPMAICLPHVEFTLIDRAGRRVDLMRRAIRILELENCRVMKADLESLHGDPEVIVSRASLPPERLAGVVERLLDDDGMAVVAGSWEREPQHPGWEVVEIPPDVLDRTVWLLIMRRQ